MQKSSEMRMLVKVVCIIASLAVCSAFSLHRSSRGVLNLKSTKVDDKAEVKEYFDNEGFNRWNKIYSETGEVNKVQLDIRTGHQQTIDKVLAWVESEDNTKKTLCDAGCGVGSLAIPMAKKFGKIYASDISDSMTNEAASRSKSQKIKNIEVSPRQSQQHWP